MRISKEKVEAAITLKQWYHEKLSKFKQGEDELGHDYLRDAEERNKQLNEFEDSAEFHLFKEFLEGLSEGEHKDLLAIGFYGRGDHEDFASALKEAAQMQQNAADIQYTMQLLAAAEYLEAGFDKLNQRHEI